MRTVCAVVVAEGELKDLHPREAEALTKLDHLRRDLAQILGDESGAGKLALNRFEEVRARPRLPLPVDGRLGLGGRRSSSGGSR